VYDFDPINLFRRSLASWPRNEALRIGDRSFTYADLDNWSSAITAAIIEAGAEHERIIFIADRNASSYAIILGILKAGCSYVPLHPDGPAARWQAMIAKCGARFAIEHATHAFDVAHVIALQASLEKTQAFGQALDPASEAYVLFTSGSTGGPKGVSVSRANVAAYLEHILGAYDFNERDLFTQHFALTFDLSVHDLFVCWGSGACLCVPPDDGALRAASWAREQGITVWFSVPSLAALMMRVRSLTPAALPALRYSFFCGEALPWSIANAWKVAASNSRLINLYGPTETTIAITTYEVDRASSTTNDGVVPIGEPFPGQEAIIVDEELCLRGSQVSSGYVNDASATAKAFVGFPGREGIWYRTGDRVRIDEDGVIHYLGRTDHQVKVLGQRVEPGEVDEVIARLIHGGNAVTVPVQEAGATRLVTFIDTPSDINTLLESCRTLLPPHMIPARIIVIPAMPLTAHGKVDRQRLIDLATNG